LRGIRLENVEIQANSGFTIRHARGLRFENVTINGKSVSAPADNIIGETRDKPTGKAG
jgi:hypothetical protein